MEAVIFVGIQGSGKSSFYRQQFFDTHVRISLDVLRTRHREQLLFAACLAAKQPFVVDNTNPLLRDRARYIEPARKAGFRVVAYFFDSGGCRPAQQSAWREAENSSSGNRGHVAETASSHPGRRLRRGS
jgi:predicted kinase